MTVLFTARDVAEAAVEKEKQRRQFYAAVTEQATDPKMKKLFEFLTEEEDRHVAAFEQIRDGISKDAPPLPEYAEDMDAYMDSMIDDRLYSDVDSAEFVKGAVESKDAIRMAIGFEKDAILYFREFLPYLSEDDQQVVQGLIDEEKGHIRMLGKLKKELG
jgi:rubrerythrin